MVDIRELMHEAAETTRPPLTEDFTRAVSGRIRRRRLLRGSLVVVLVLAIAGGGAGYAFRGFLPHGTDLSHGQAVLPASGRTGRAVWANANCSTGTCSPVVAMADGTRYKLPGEISGGAQLFGTALSRSGRWIAYNRAGGVEVRDLSSTTAYHTMKAGNGGYPLAWSADERWVVLASEHDDGSMSNGGGSAETFNTLVRIDLRSGHVLAFDPNSITGHDVRVVGVTPAGEVLIGATGAKPAPPTKFPQLAIGPGLYRTLDPVARKLGPALSVPKSIFLTSQDVARIDPSRGAKHTARYDWMGLAVPMLTTPDGRQTAVAMSSNPDMPVTVTFTDPSGHPTSVDLTAVLRKQAKAFQWIPVSFTGSTITLLAKTGMNGFTRTVTVDLATRAVTAGHAIDYPEDSLVPGNGNLTE